MPHRTFLCYTSSDSPFVLEAARHLRAHLGEIFYYEDSARRPGQSFLETLVAEIKRCTVIVVFVGMRTGDWQSREIELIVQRAAGKEIHLVVLRGEDGSLCALEGAVELLGTKPRFEAPSMDARGARDVAARIVQRLGLHWSGDDDLPLNPHLFSYEKDIIKFFARMHGAGGAERSDEDREKILFGCPQQWPSVVRWAGKGAPNRLDPQKIGEFRPDEARVLTSALLGAADPGESAADDIRRQLCFPEAGPRRALLLPRVRNELKVAVLVSGGIAPGINAVIDGIVQRHWLYAEAHGYAESLKVYGIQNGFRAFETDTPSRLLAASPEHYKDDQLRRLETSHHVNEGGSILGTSRVGELIDLAKRTDKLKEIVHQLRTSKIDVLYVIGGDGSMKAAHAIWSTAAAQVGQQPLSVVAIPKTMDNDVLWVWQSFGFLSAVEKAREVIEHLHTEVESNPRLCIAQLFGSDSGFVVSHAVVASATDHCYLALIPEVPFSLKRVAAYLKERMAHTPIPFGLVVLAETAIPTDAMDYVGAAGEAPRVDLKLTDDDKEAIRGFDEMRRRDASIQGQTDDALRTAGLKIVRNGLDLLLRDTRLPPKRSTADWSKLRVFTNEPRHLLRAIPPSCSDVIIGHRLGTLAVDNAMAGYTDFMISQWLTEYVLVPLKLVVLGRKRIPRKGIFWKSVLAKTGQPPDLGR